MLDSSPLKDLLKGRLTGRQIAQLKRVFRGGQGAWVRIAHAKDLRRIGQIFQAGKCDWYYPLYERHLGPLRTRRLNLLEIGIGGYETAAAGGGSLRMWESYLPRARVHGVDIHDKSPHDAGRVRTFMGSQTDEPFLRALIRSIGRPDVIIDDGSHVNQHVLTTFNVLFPLLAADGIYVIEDTQSSYWEPFGGSSRDLGRGDTSMGFVKGLIDGLNYKELRPPRAAANDFESTVVEVHCYHNIVFIQKGHNDTVHDVDV